MHPFLQAQLAVLHENDLRAEAAAARGRGASASKPAAADAPTEVVIRRATAADGPALAALSALDGAPALHGDALVAEVAGAPRAVLPLDTGARPFGDPFRRTQGLVDLLELRAAQLRRAAREDRSSHRRLAWMSPAALRRFV